jgi:hypothetical protein
LNPPRSVTSNELDDGLDAEAAARAILSAMAGGRMRIAPAGGGGP